MSARLRNGSRRRRRTFGVAVIAFAASLTLDSDPGWTYRLYRSSEDDSLVPRSDTAERWHPGVWGPGETLTWYVADDPDWSPHFADANEALRRIEDALETWGRIPTADIRVRLDGLVKRASLARDNRNVVLINPDTSILGYSYRWHRKVRGVFQTVECDVELGPAVAAVADEEQPAGLTWLIHEFGHCFGLSHPAVTPTARWRPRKGGRSWLISSVWEQDPVMTYGASVNNLLTEDDMVGVSLLRPAQGWLGTPGSISGRLTLDGEPARFVSVHVLRNDGGRALPSVRVFSDEEGAFLVEGLVPGDYFLWIYPLVAQSPNQWMLDHGAVIDVKDLLDFRPVRVQAGQEVRAGEFALRRGREDREYR